MTDYNMDDRFTENRYKRFDEASKRAMGDFFRSMGFVVYGEDEEHFRGGDLLVVRGDEEYLVEIECRPKNWDGDRWKFANVHVPIRKLHGHDKWHIYISINEEHTSFGMHNPRCWPRCSRSLVNGCKFIAVPLDKVKFFHRTPSGGWARTSTETESSCT